MAKGGFKPDPQALRGRETALRDLRAQKKRGLAVKAQQNRSARDFPFFKGQGFPSPVF
jgi:hypothetical protein